ncbi:hypothetical protein [Streptomyces sp. NPDC002054]
MKVVCQARAGALEGSVAPEEAITYVPLMVTAESLPGESCSSADPL